MKFCGLPSAIEKIFPVSRSVQPSNLVSSEPVVKSKSPVMVSPDLETLVESTSRSRNLNDKQWVTEKFCQVIRWRQYAWTHRHMADYCRYRNQALRLVKTLRKRFYDAKIEHLRHSDSRNWWQQMKRFTGQSNHCDLSGLTNTVANGYAKLLADMVNESLKRVSDDLQPLCDVSTPNGFVVPDQYLIAPQSVLAKLERIRVHKAPGPDGLPNWVLKEFVPFLYEPLCAIFNASVWEGSMQLR